MDNLPAYQWDLLLHEPLHNCIVATCVCIHKPPYTHWSTSTAQNLCTIFFFIRRLSHLKKGDKKLVRSCIATVATNVMTPPTLFPDWPTTDFFSSTIFKLWAWGFTITALFSVWAVDEQVTWAQYGHTKCMCKFAHSKGDVLEPFLWPETPL